MFAENGRHDGKIAWIKFWAQNDDEAAQLEELYKAVMGRDKDVDDDTRKVMR